MCANATPQVLDGVVGDGVVDEVSLLGRPIGRRCLTALLGIGCHRLRKALRGTPDLRHSFHGQRVPRERPKEAHVDAFFAQLYITTSESFPTGHFNRKLVSELRISVS